MAAYASMSCFQVDVFNSAPPYIARKPASPSDTDTLSELFLGLFRALANPNDHRLLAPFLATLHENSCTVEDFSSAEDEQDYCLTNQHRLRRMAADLRERLSHTAITVLIVNTDELRWVACSHLAGMEHTVVVEQRLLDVIKLGTPEARLFGFLCAYGESGHMARRWKLSRRKQFKCIPKTIGPSAFDMTAASFVEWAGFGGVSSWVPHRGLGLQREKNIYHISSEDAKAWWDCGHHYPHLVDFVNTRFKYRSLDSTLNPITDPSSSPTCSGPTIPPTRGPSPIESRTSSAQHSTIKPSRTPKKCIPRKPYNSRVDRTTPTLDHLTYSEMFSLPVWNDRKRPNTFPPRDPCVWSWKQ